MDAGIQSNSTDSNTSDEELNQGELREFYIYEILEGT